MSVSNRQDWLVDACEMETTGILCLYKWQNLLFSLVYAYLKCGFLYVYFMST